MTDDEVSLYVNKIFHFGNIKHFEDTLIGLGESCVTGNIIPKFSIIRRREHQVSRMTSQLINCLPQGGDNDLDHVILLGNTNS